MPCDSSHCEPTQREKESLQVIDLLREVGFNIKKTTYGQTDKLDKHTALLCDWCNDHPLLVREQSLELQIWWRDHQKADAEKAQAKQRLGEIRAKVDRAKAKLTAEERRLLGIF